MGVEISQFCLKNGEHRNRVLARGKNTCCANSFTTLHREICNTSTTISAFYSDIISSRLNDFVKPLMGKSFR